jgi:hypothetical protein
VIFDEFQITPHTLEILDALVELVNNGIDYSPQMKKAIIQKILSNYPAPKKLICY